ncbi:pyruvate kinase, partial [Parabacteroides sp. OttesenSCG-928-N08]|nr:pyruvate kinase [Parabacteroides sp. OttesenSCG-928-N08]
MLKHTKIVATISDQRCEVEFIDSLYKAGMNVVRMNTAHLTAEGLSRIVNNVRSVSDRIGILMDTKGPEIRTTILKEPVRFKTGELVRMAGDPDKESGKDCIYVSYRNFFNDLHIGDDILIDDGDLELKVLSKEGDYLMCEAQNDATLGSRKSVNVPGVRINLPSLTERDRMNIDWAIEHELDFIAHSFVRSKQDVLDIQRILDEKN